MKSFNYFAFYYGILSLIFLTSSPSGVKGQNCQILEADRIDCNPWTTYGSEDVCLSKGCRWCPPTPPNGAPFCHLPPDYGYRMVQEEELPDGSGYLVHLTRATNITYVGNDSENITALFHIQSDTRLRIKITDGKDRFEVPLEINPPPAGPSNPLFDIQFTNDPVFSFKVVRKASGVAIFDTSLGGLTFEDQFLQMSIKVPSRNAYGIGENEQSSFRHVFGLSSFGSWQRFALWTRDDTPQGNRNIYGAQPYYTVLEDDGNVHSVLLLNSNAQEFILSPAPGYIYRTIGGIFDIYIFMGPKPEDAQRQYTQAIGRSPIPPYWGIGFHLCRWGYNSLTNMKAAMSRLKDAGIPQDVQFGDLDILQDWRTLTYDKVAFAGLPEYIKEIKDNGIKFIVTVNPGIPTNNSLIDYWPEQVGNDMDAWVKRPDGTPTIGRVWAGSSYFIDYSRDTGKAFWTYALKRYKEEIDWDGVWLDMNEPVSWSIGDSIVGCANTTINNPPYVPGISNHLYHKTLCADSVQDYGIHYNTHSLYGWSQAKATHEATREILGTQRTISLSRSTFTGAGQWANHWLGDNRATWADMVNGIIGMLSFNLFGIPFVGPDICGFYATPTEELCTRWLQVGAFFPYSRNHNAWKELDQDPGVWSETSRNSTRTALLIRYTLLPYLYYLFYIHRTQGDTVARAIWHEFPNDELARGVDKQFLWGSAFLVSPVLTDRDRHVLAHFPLARWYSYYDGQEVVGGGSSNLTAPFDFIPLHVRGGYILPTQEPALNTQISRLNPFGLIVALSEDNTATGGMYWDDGETFDVQETGVYYESTFSYSGNVLSQAVLSDGYAPMSDRTLGSIRLFGQSSGVTLVLVNGVPHTDFINGPTKEIIVRNLNVQMNTNFSITFQFSETPTSPPTTTTAAETPTSPPTTTTAEKDNGVGTVLPGKVMLIVLFLWTMKINHE